MRVTISGRHMEVTEALKQHVDDRLRKVRAHFDRVIDADVVLSVEKHRHIAEITVHANGVSLHGKEDSSDMYVSIDAVVDKLDKQIRKFKDRSHKHPRTSLAEQEAMAAAGLEANSTWKTGVATDVETAPEIVRERMVMRPISPDDAVQQLNAADDSFLAFVNIDTQQVNVLYRGQDGQYVLLEPQY